MDVALGEFKDQAIKVVDQARAHVDNVNAKAEAERQRETLENQRKRAEMEKIKAENRRLNVDNVGIQRLEAEAVQLKATITKLEAERDLEKHKCEKATELSRRGEDMLLVIFNYFTNKKSLLHLALENRLKQERNIKVKMNNEGKNTFIKHT